MTEFFNRSSEKHMRRRLRKAMPPAEALLWSHLRGRQLLGVKFRRQYSVGPYCIDFHCPEFRLAIELDGESHFTERAQEYDAGRQKYIESLGIRFLRFTNDDVYGNLEGVIEVIAKAIGGEAAPRGAEVSSRSDIPRLGHNRPKTSTGG